LSYSPKKLRFHCIKLNHEDKLQQLIQKRSLELITLNRIMC